MAADRKFSLILETLNIELSYLSTRLVIKVKQDIKEDIALALRFKGCIRIADCVCLHFCDTDQTAQSSLHGFMLTLLMLMFEFDCIFVVMIMRSQAHDITMSYEWCELIFCLSRLDPRLHYYESTFHMIMITTMRTWDKSNDIDMDETESQGQGQVHHSISISSILTSPLFLLLPLSATGIVCQVSTKW